MLFVELTIIRWTSSNLYYLFAVSNLILLASFLGIGMGFLRSSQRNNFFYLSPLLLALLICLCYYFAFDPVIRLNPATDNIDYRNSYFSNNIYPVWMTLPIIFCLTVALMQSLAEGVKKYFILFPALQAYRVEILGSLTGLIVFSLVSLLQAPPYVWGMIICASYLVLLRSEKTISVIDKIWQYMIIVLQVSSLILIMMIFIRESLTVNHFWSSYYKIVLQPYAGNRYAVNVNGLVQQIIESAEQRERVKPFYTVPYQYRDSALPLNRVLIIGAGTGGDVAIALKHGAKQVDAVEIDPMLYQIGKKFNPDKVYDDPRVNIFIDDGRAYLQHNQQKYDLIIYALTDSLMLIMGQSSLRLENYLYTQEGINAAANHLTANGIFAIYNYIQPTWLVNRLAKTMQNTFSHVPCIKSYSAMDYYATVLLASNHPAILHCSAYWHANSSAEIYPATDNYPFIYMQDSYFPKFYLICLAGILLLSLMILKLSGIGFNGIYQYVDLFLMGVAFLLLETKNIISFALLFGTTWFVNALVFIGIIFTVYLAIEFAYRKPSINQRLLYLLLLLSLLLAWLIPLRYLLDLSALPRFVVAVLLAFSPIFIANLIFAERFRKTEQSAIAFGANLIGAVLGGMLEYLSLMIGYRHLFIVIAAIYALAIVLRPRNQ